MIRRFRRVTEKILYLALKNVPQIELYPTCLGSATLETPEIALTPTMLGGATTEEPLIELSYTMTVS